MVGNELMKDICTMQSDEFNIKWIGSPKGKWNDKKQKQLEKLRRVVENG